MSLRTHDAFLALVGKIEEALREHLSESTLERMWGYSTREADALSLRTLDVLSKYAGYASWDDFCRRLKDESPVESEELMRDAIFTSALEKGSIVRLGWLPDRLIEAEYLGGSDFIIRSSLNSSLNPGDSFKCLQFQKGAPLFLDHFRRAGEEKEHRYVAGERNGLTVIDIEHV
ncbi:MAG: hypothetical protein MJY44_02340 [Bacteroidales bacterium]|nr:hypothetical protein [Bacteroidales bacterium]